MAFKMKGSPFKVDDGPGKGKKKNIKKGTVNAARELLKEQGVNNPNLSDAEVLNAAKVKNVYKEASSRAKRAAGGGDSKYGYSA